MNEPLEQLEMRIKEHEYKPKKKKKNDPEIFGLRKFPKKADDGDSSGGRPLDLISIENEEEKSPIKGDKKTHKRDIKNKRNDNEEKKFENNINNLIYYSKS